MDSLLGKIVRINADGSIPKDNPFVGKEGVRPEIWSLGHRNIQAATLHPDDRRAVGSRARHARRRRDQHRAQGQGLRLADDRLRHRVSRRPDHRRHHGARTGWSSRSTTGIRSSRRAAWSFYTGDLFPAWKGSLFIGGMGSTNLVRLTLEGEKVVGEERLLNDLQPKPERIRDVRQGPDGALYLLTDSRARPAAEAGAEEVDAARRSSPFDATGIIPAFAGGPIPRAVRDCRAARRRRHGRGVSRPRHTPWP